jgi:DNA-binding PadR family transcriptional regulator
MSDSRREPHEFLPLSHQDFQVLLVLKNEPRHGYGIVQAAGEQFPAEPALEIGSLYRIVSRMLEQGLIREVGRPRRQPIDGRRRRFYGVTDLGLSVARAEAARLRTLLHSPQAVELLEDQ